MKNFKNIISGIVIGLTLITQLVGPLTVYADRDTTPAPTEAPPVATPPLPTDTVVTASTALPTDAPPVVIPVLPTDTEVTDSTALPTDTDPVATTPLPTDTEVTDSTALPTDAPQETSTPLPTDAPTDFVPTETPETTATDLPTETPIVSDSPTVAPVETVTPPPPTDILQITSTPLPADTSTDSAPAATPETTTTDLPTETPIVSDSPTVAPVETVTPPPPTDAPQPATVTVDAPTPTVTVTDTAPADTSTSEQPPLLETVQAVFSDTSVVVLDANGQPLSLASQAAADVIAISDPMWCPDGVAPGGVGCTASYASMALLLINEGANINSQSVGGTIWITSGSVGDINPITIDGSTYSNWANYSLTLQGGWSGISGNTTIGSNSIFSVPITIQNWNSNVAISNVTTTGVIVRGTNLRNVSINNVTANQLVTFSNTSGNTVSISNSSFNGGGGSYIDGWLNTVNINNSHFDNNAGDGLLEFNGWGGITISNSTFDGNTGNGANINPYGGTSVTINGSEFSGNGSNGVNISQAGSVTINNSNFDSNGYDGADVSGNSNGISNVTIDNSAFIGNGSNGVSISSVGDTTITNSNFSQNFTGADISSNGSVNIINSNFDSNGYDGLDAFMNGGVVDIQGSTFNNNNQIGCDGYGAWLLGAGNITVNQSVFNQNFAGLSLPQSNNTTVNNSEFQSNYVGIGYNAFNNLNTQTDSFLGNIFDTIDLSNFPYSNDCNYATLPPVSLILSAQKESKKFDLNCIGQDGFTVSLANGDLVNIFCPVEGKALLKRLDNTTLPADLPTGYTYASAFTLSILQEGKPIQVIKEGGYILASFVGQPLQPGNTYSVLYWDDWKLEDGKWVEHPDKGVWVPLKDFLVGRNGQLESFPLYPGAIGDSRKIVSGVKLVTKKDGLTRVDISTNFPGIFALVQH